MIRKIFTFIWILLVVQSYSYDLNIFFTGDSHGKIVSQQGMRDLFERDDVKIGGADLLADAYYKNMDKEGNNILISLGDIFDGSFVTDNFKGKPMIDIMEKIPYDYYVPGNHDFTFGVDLLKKYFNDINTKTVCTNLVYRDNYEHVFEPYRIIEKENFKVGLLSFLTPTVKYSTNIEKMGLKAVDPFQIAEFYMNKLKSEGVNIIIFLNHMGFEEDKKMASKFNPDIILGGHSHTIMRRVEKVGDTIIAHAGSSFFYLGDLRLDIEYGKIRSYKYRLHRIDSKSYESEVDVKKIVSFYDDKVSEKLNEVLFENEEDLLRAENKELSNLYRFLVVNMEQGSGADLAELNLKGIRADLKKGNITLRDIYKVLPFGNEAVMIKIKGIYLLKDEFIYLYKNIDKDKYYNVITNSYIAERSETFLNHSVKKTYLKKSVRDIIAENIRKNYK